jgi:orotidine-5'-phosphate decarboxylase
VRSRLIVALDVNSLGKVQALVERLGDEVEYYKVGMELYYSVGNVVFSYLQQQNKKIFLDLKLHDIPNTVAKSLKMLTALGVTMLNVHAVSGLTMMRAAREAVDMKAAELGVERPKLIAVTVLTSLNPAEWEVLNYSTGILEQALSLAKLAKQAGLDGVVASPREASLIKAECGEDFLIVTPGIRPLGTAAGDQSRILTPKEAVRSGATHLVVGRPVTENVDPVNAVRAIIDEMRGI